MLILFFNICYMYKIVIKGEGAMCNIETWFYIKCHIFNTNNIVMRPHPLNCVNTNHSTSKTLRYYIISEQIILFPAQPIYKRKKYEYN